MFCCHSATNLLKHQYLGTFWVAAGWQQISIYGVKQQKQRRQLVDFHGILKNISYLCSLIIEKI